MKITQVTFKRILNLQNYNSGQLELTATVEEGEDPEEAARQLMSAVDDLLTDRYFASSDPDDAPY